MAPKASDVVVPKAAEKDDKKVEVGKDGKPLSKKELEAKKKAEEDELSEDDKQLKEELELCVTRLGETSSKSLLVLAVSIQLESFIVLMFCVSNLHFNFLSICCV